MTDRSPAGTAAVLGADYLDSFSSIIAAALRRAGWITHNVPFESVLPIGRRSLRAQIYWSRLVRLVAPLERSANERAMARVIALRPDLVIADYNAIRPESVRRLRGETDAILVHWFPDAFINLDRQYILASDYHLHFFKDRYIVRFFREKLGKANAFYLPHGCDRDLHRPVELTDEDRRIYGCDLTTAGNLYYYRARMLEPFLDYDLKIWGDMPRWLDAPITARRTGRVVFGLEKSKAFRAAKIVLNTMHFGEIEAVNQRAFDAAGCGAFQIMDENPALPELFEPGREIVTFSTRADLKDKVDYYLARPQERAEIAERAQRRAHAEHTMDHRIAVILDHVRRLRGGQPDAARPVAAAGTGP